MRIRRKKTALAVGVLAVTIAVGAVMAAGTASAQQSALPRAQTLYTSGTAWGPFASFHPNRNEKATGVLGLLYETLFRYDPLKDRFIPWLATNGRWQGKTYVVSLRNGVRWNDGRPFTAADVKFTFESFKLPGSEHGTMWKTGLQRISTQGNQVRFHFNPKGQPNFLDWDTNMYSIAIVPRHIWSSYSAQEQTTGNADKSFVGTGPFRYGAGKGSSQTLQWNRNDQWWAIRALGLRMPMRYIVDIHNSQNTASLQNFQANNIDLSNNFFPGIDKLIDGRKISTYYQRAPYMLSANTAWLVPNTTKKPLNDKVFRRALATSIDINQIVTADYGNIVARANPTGLLPVWSKWIDQAQVRELGFTYSTARARQLLQQAGYPLKDGFFTNKDGSPINLRLIVPNGWSDWMTAIQMISASAEKAGIRITPAYPDYNGLVDERNSGKFDLVINNDKQIGNTPYTYYDYLFHLPIADQQTFANYSRFTEAGAKPWALTLKLNKTNPSNEAAAKRIHSQIQRVILEDLPAIPLWYNGMWAQYNNTHWTNFPKSTGAGLQNTPSMWNGYLNMTGIDALAKLRPTGR